MDVYQIKVRIDDHQLVFLEGLQCAYPCNVNDERQKFKDVLFKDNSAL